MSIITVEELQVALNRTFTDGEAAQAQYYIDTVSAYVESYTGVAFTLHEAETVRQQSDYYGEIKLAPGPIVEVGEVSRVFPPNVARFYGFDGIDTLYNLEPHTAYDVILTYGYETPPADIKGFVTESCREVVNNPNSLSQFRVGDVTETYGDTAPSPTSFSSLGSSVLESYKVTETTWKTGPRAFTHRPELPVL